MTDVPGADIRNCPLCPLHAAYLASAICHVQVTRPRQEEAVSEPDIVLEVEKENVGFKLPSGTAMRCLLQPSTVSSSQGVRLTVSFQETPPACLC